MATLNPINPARALNRDAELGLDSAHVLYCRVAARAAKGRTGQVNTKPLEREEKIQGPAMDKTATRK
jgi:hypothetical protein